MTQPTRPWYRIHLSTVIVVLLLAAVLIGVNAYGHIGTKPMENDPKDYCTVVKRGWPQTFYYAIYHRSGRYAPPPNWYYKSLAIDAGLLLGILAAEACAWECVVRLREKRKAN